MEQIGTKYGKLHGVVRAEFYANGTIRQCILNQANEITTSYGLLTPQYTEDGVRRKYAKSLSFYPNGDLKTVSLQEQTPVVTPAGIFPAELLTFYEGERLHRLFPLNGKLSGFWSEANEYALAPELEFDLPVAKFKRKIIGIRFYEDGALRGITFWPQESLRIESPAGFAEIRIGFSFYPDGRLQSLEPLHPLAVETPIGAIWAFNTNASGIHGDANSLVFSPEGRVQSLVTSTDQVTVTGRDGSQIIYQPGLKPSLFHDERMDIMPLAIEFPTGKTRFCHDDAHQYELTQHGFFVRTQPLRPQASCAGCMGDCDACGSMFPEE